MKKIFILLLVLFTAADIAAAQDWRTDDVYYAFNFGDGLYPEYTQVCGEWMIGNKHDEFVKKYTFDEKEEDFLPVSGNWSISGGKYIQNQMGMSALTRSMLGGRLDGFDISFEATPLSEENTLMIYFGSESGNDGCSVEINSYQSKLISDGEEYIGKGAVVKNNTYQVRLLSDRNNLILYLNGEIILRKTDMPIKNGRVGIGSWNSAFEFDNLVLSSMPSLGRSEKLIGSGKKAEVVFSELTAENFVYKAKLSADNITDGSVGIVVRASENGGYYLGIDANGAYISDKNSGKKLAKGEFKPRSGVMYELAAECDRDKITFYIDDEKIISAKNSEYKEGACGFFEKDTKVYCENADMRLIRNTAPPIISEGGKAYYIDSENGNDLNSGESAEKAWKSIYRLRDCTLSDGDSILLKRGAVYGGTLYIKNLNPENEISVSAYGEGEKPVISGCTRGIVIENSSNIKISSVDIKLRHYAADETSELGVGYGAELINSPNISFENCGFSCTTDGAYTAAIETDSIFNEPECREVSYSGFFKNALCTEGAERETDNNGSDEHWAYKYMKILMEENIISEYRPDDKISRAEFASMLTAALRLNESEYRGIFKDVTEDMWYAKKLQTISDYRFLPLEMTDGAYARATDTLKRAELAAIAVLAAGCTADEQTEFSDESSFKPWMIRYINSAVSNEIMSADDDGNFNPEREVTRAEAAVVLIKLRQYK